MLFQLDNVSLSRDGAPVLRELTASLPEGMSCLFGPSGSGKSTTLRLLNRLADPDSGEVRYRGEDVRARDVLGLRREACFVPQLPALYPGTVEDNVRLGIRLASDQGQDDGAPKDADCARCLTLSGLDPSFAARPADRLSVGERQRAMLARALALDPKVLLLDEPTSALDERARAAVESTLLELRDRLGISMVVVTHDREQARRLSDWTVRIDAGRAVEQGPTEEVLG